jgi:hypothetical protein
MPVDQRGDIADRPLRGPPVEIHVVEVEPEQLRAAQATVGEQR